MTKTLAIACVVLAGSAAGALAQDLAAGETSFKKCLPCHRVGPEAKNLVGPVLNGLEGRKSGTIESEKERGDLWAFLKQFDASGNKK